MTGEHCSVITIPLQRQNSHVERATVITSIVSDSWASPPPHEWLYSDAGLPYLQLLPAGRERILWAFQCKSWWMGLPVLPGCSGSVSSSSRTLSSGWACCSAHQMHTRGLSPTPPGMWISVRGTNIQKWAGFSSCIAPLLVPLTTERREKEWEVCSGIKPWVSHKHRHTLNEQKHHSEPILGLIQNNSILTNLENGPHSCIN